MTFRCVPVEDDCDQCHRRPGKPRKYLVMGPYYADAMLRRKMFSPPLWVLVWRLCRWCQAVETKRRRRR